jgi:hypothetical protein
LTPRQPLPLQVRVVYDAECPAEWRRAIRRYYGLGGIATRAECAAWLERYGSSMDDNLAALMDDDGARPQRERG